MAPRFINPVSYLQSKAMPAPLPRTMPRHTESNRTPSNFLWLSGFHFFISPSCLGLFPHFYEQGVDYKTHRGICQELMAMGEHWGGDMCNQLLGKLCYPKLIIFSPNLKFLYNHLRQKLFLNYLENRLRTYFFKANVFIAVSKL